MYNFDKLVDRRNTGSLKVDLISREGLPEDTLPLWVADMDFETVPEVKEALKAAADHGIYGYTIQKDTYFEAVHNWFLRRFGWEIKQEWAIQTPGVVFALAAAVRAYTREGESVLIQRPVYHPFSKVVEANGRIVINNPLVYKEGSYQIDFGDFEEKIIRNHVKLFLLCSPHNPVGRVWKEEELRRMGEICFKHGVFVVADEIHCDFIRKGFCHYNFASLGEDFADNCMICTAPSKTFNLAGLQISNVFIPNENRRKLMQEELERVSCQEPGLFGLAACEAAYRYGESWLEELLTYLEGNLEYIQSFLKEKLPKIRLVNPEGTYLLWMDVSSYGYTSEQIADRLRNHARLWVNDGGWFGPEGGGFLRVNMASPRSVIVAAMERLLEF